MLAKKKLKKLKHLLSLNHVLSILYKRAICWHYATLNMGYWKDKRLKVGVRSIVVNDETEKAAKHTANRFNRIKRRFVAVRGYNR